MAKFKPGQSGNPRGRPPGRSTAQGLRERLAERAGEVLAVVLDAALSGDLMAARLVLERVVPALRPQASPVELPALAAAGTLTERAGAILAAAGAGEIGPDVAAHLLAALGGVARIAEIDELMRRVAALEAEHGEAT